MAMTRARLDVRERILAAARQKILLLPHAVRHVSRPDRMITVEEVRSVPLRGADSYLAVITAYLSSPDEWELDFQTRRKA